MIAIIHRWVLDSFDNELHIKLLDACEFESEFLEVDKATVVFIETIKKHSLVFFVKVEALFGAELL
jgi:hypothetical protein